MLIITIYLIIKDIFIFRIYIQKITTKIFNLKSLIFY